MKKLHLRYVTMTRYDDTYQNVNVIFEKDGIFISAVVLMLPLYLFIGHLLSILGAFLEKTIDKIEGVKHPVIEIFKSYPDVEREMGMLFPPLKKDNGKNH